MQKALPDGVELITIETEWRGDKHVQEKSVLELGTFWIVKLDTILKHKDSFGKSENLSKTFFTEILVFHPDYECKTWSSIGFL